MKDWSNFYTPKIIANEIISKLPKNYRPNLAIDICVGSGNFLDVAFKKWSNINLVGVDLCTKNVQNNNNYDLYDLDALNLDKLKTVLSPYLSYNKLLLANPPFGKIDDLSRYTKFNIEDSAIYNTALKSQRIESLMLVSNLSILKYGDYFGAILPENFFTSNKLREFRKMFISNFDNILIGNSEKHFPTSEVKTRLFIGKYKGNKTIRVGGDLSKKNKAISISDFKLYRGIDNSLLISEEQVYNHCNYNEVLHFSNPKGEVLRKKFVITNSKYDNLKVSEGDTLILRVGRSSGLTFSSNNFYLGKYISDYFYVFKDSKLSREQRLNLELNLKNKVNGLTTKYLRKSDIISCLNNIL